MFKVIFFIAVILLVVFIIALIVVGLCLGIAHLMIYFIPIPTIELVNTLVPAAILTTVLIVVFGEMIKSWVGNAWAESQSILSDYYEDEEEDDEPEPPPVTRSHPARNNRNRR